MYTKKTIKETVTAMDTNLADGLSSTEAAKRLNERGTNTLVDQKAKSYLQMFLAQLNEPLIFVLFIAASISLLLREYSDTVIILIVILVNAVIGVIQEGKAQKALDALKQLSAPTALVRRDKEAQEIAAADLVIGDIVILNTGNQIPADLRLISSNNLKIEESSLTGESLATHKDASSLAREDLPIGDRKNMAFMTTNVVLGRGEGIVVATGMNTEIGKIAKLINDTPDETTPLQKRLADLGKLLSILAIILCVGLFIIALFQKRDILDMLITAISLAVAAVPEGLPAIVTIVLALGVGRLVKVNTIIRRLPSVETLGAVSIVCSDKTGTLTQNKMTVTKCYCNNTLFESKTLSPSHHETLIEGLILCNNASIQGDLTIGDPTELALIHLASPFGITRTSLEKRQPRTKELPFDSNRKMMTTMHKTTNGFTAYTKGAPDVILKRCSSILISGTVKPLTSEYKKRIEAAIHQMSTEALRVLALAVKKDSSRIIEKDLTFVGLAGMIDPPRPEAKEAVAAFKKASIKTVMITGDHIETAFAIANQIGIADSISQCITGAMLDQLSEEELNRRISSLCVFARVSPEHKVRIVKAFKSNGSIVSMTGDGVNDAPSLKAADIGVAMGLSGTDVAKNASDLILTDDNFATIEKAIVQGRGIYANIKKSILFLLSSNFGEIITMFITILCGLASPLKAIHILWINLITDSMPALALGVDQNDETLLMEEPPRNPKESLFAHGGLFYTLFYGIIIALISLTAFLLIPISCLKQNELELTLKNISIVLKDTTLLNQAQTYAFTVLGLSQLFHAIGMRNVKQSIFDMNHRENKLMIFAFVAGYFLQIIVTEIPYLIKVFETSRLSIWEWMLLSSLASIPLWFHEILLLFQPSVKKCKQIKVKSLGFR